MLVLASDGTIVNTDKIYTVVLLDPKIRTDEDYAILYKSADKTLNEYISKEVYEILWAVSEYGEKV